MSQRPRHEKIFTIPAGQPFADRLAAGLMARAAARDAPFALADMLVLLPNRRACRTVREALLRQGGGEPVLLPRLRPIGDVDEESLILTGADSAALDTVMALRPAVPPVLRQILLAQLIIATRKQQAGAADALAASPTHAVALAADLADLLDRAAIEECDLARLGDLAPERYAAHWQVTVRFLEILSQHWPRILADCGWSDIAARRSALIRAQAALWRDRPPLTPVVVAGSTGSVPATGVLMSAVLDLPQGEIVLPGLEPDTDNASWAALDENHPQYGLKHLLARLQIDHHEVRAWPAARIADSRAAARRRLLAEALRPPETTERWQALAPPAGGPEIDAAALDGLCLIGCDRPEQEAAVIALILREALETPGRTAALVTLDRDLARRVAGQMQRWGIAVDDSAGVPLAQSGVGRFLRLLAGAASQAFAPIDLLALLKHPLAAAGMEPGAFAAAVRRLEIRLLRGPRPPAGIAGLYAALDAAAIADSEQAARLRAVIDAVGACLGPLQRALADNADLAAAVQAHIESAEALAATPGEPGADRLWRGEDGEAARAFLLEVQDGLAAHRVIAQERGGLPADGYVGIFDNLMAGRTVRPRYGSHRRLGILGPLEARLYQADVMILGGLNEDSWPPHIEADPWLSRPMARQFGLPAPERAIGLAAHDFVQAASAPTVYLTRAARAGKTPTAPARWLLRLEAVLEAAGLTERVARGTEWKAWADALDAAPGPSPAPRPRPCPPVAARPRRLPVSAIELWRRDPYALYAQRILGLRALAPLDQPPDAAERGTLIHRALELFARRYPDRWPNDPHAALMAAGREAFGPLLDQPEIWAFWWPRFERIATWFAATEGARRAQWATAATEVAGSLNLSGPAGPFTVTATADRIDRERGSGALAVIDYKTGKLPRDSEIALGYAPQLPLEAAIAAAGGFTGIGAQPVAELAYWQVKGAKQPGQIKPLDDPDGLQRAALSGLAHLIARFDDPDMPYYAAPWPGFEAAFSDYDHLARSAEWRGGIS